MSLHSAYEPPSNEVLCYSALNMVMLLKYAME